MTDTTQTLMHEELTQHITENVVVPLLQLNR
jgi:hypothetical protein